jgi:hypothetical protein
MKRLLLLLILLVASPCWAANWYVDADNGNDTTGDGTAAAPEKSISAAITDAATGDTIKLIGGTYNDDTQIWGIDLLGKNLTIEPNVVGTRITITRTAEGASSVFRFLADRTGFSYTWNNIDFVDEKTSGVLFFWYLEVGGNIILNDCTITTASSNAAFTGTTQITNNAIFRKLTLDNVNITRSGATTAKMVNLTSFAKTMIKDCNITDNTTTSTVGVITMEHTRGPVEIRGCHLTGENPIIFYNYATNGATLIIADNNLLSTEDLNGTGITLGYTGTATADTIYGAKIINNKISNFAYGINQLAYNTDIAGNTIYAVNSLAVTGGGKPFIYNNTFVSTDSGGTDGGRCIVFARKWFAKQGTVAYLNSSGTDFDTTTVIATAGGGECDFNNVLTDGSMMAFVSSTNTGSPYPLYYGIVYGTNEGANTITVDKWTKVSDYTTETPTDNTYYVSIVKYGNGAYITNNILDGSRSDYTITFDFSPLAGSNYINYNCYSAGSVSLSNLGCTAAGCDGQTTLAQLQAKWLVWPWVYSECYYNDDHSIEAVPQYNNFDTYDFTLKPNSPCINAASNGGEMGAYQFPRLILSE